MIIFCASPKWLLAASSLILAGCAPYPLPAANISAPAPDYSRYEAEHKAAMDDLSADSALYRECAVEFVKKYPSPSLTATERADAAVIDCATHGDAIERDTQAVESAYLRQYPESTRIPAYFEQREQFVQQIRRSAERSAHNAALEYLAKAPR